MDINDIFFKYTSKYDPWISFCAPITYPTPQKFS